jgi:hypothetical protein
MSNISSNRNHVNGESVDIDIRRTASELGRTRDDIVNAFLKRHCGPDVSYRTRLINAAAVSGMSSQAFHALFLQQTYGNGTADNIYPANETVAELMNRDTRTVNRANAELEELGWSTSKRRRNSPSLRSIRIPDKMMDRITSEISETTDLSLLNPSQATDLSLLTSETTKVSLPEIEKRQICHPANDKSVALSFTNKALGKEEEVNTARAVETPFLADEDFADFHEGMNAWIASNPKDLIKVKQGRVFTDKHLSKLFRNWTTLHSPEIALAAFRSVNCRASTTEAKHNPSFDGYCKYIEACMQGESGALAKMAIAQGKARTAVAVEQELGRTRVETQREIGSRQVEDYSRSAQMGISAKAKRIETMSSAQDWYADKRANRDRINGILRKSSDAAKNTPPSNGSGFTAEQIDKLARQHGVSLDTGKSDNDLGISRSDRVAIEPDGELFRSINQIVPARKRGDFLAGWREVNIRIVKWSAQAIEDMAIKVAKAVSGGMDPEQAANTAYLSHTA